MLAFTSQCRGNTVNMSLYSEFVSIIHSDVSEKGIY